MKEYNYNKFDLVSVRVHSYGCHASLFCNFNVLLDVNRRISSVYNASKSLSTKGEL